MLKPRKFDVEDSNIALLGSKLDKDARKKAADTEDAWKDAGKEIGTQIWRIEKFKVVPWPKDQYGHFYTGDSYIVLRTYKATPEAEKLSYDVHFWIGLQSSQDEYGTAAYKTVELDDYLNDDPIQHREIQGSESQLFLSYFKEIYFHEGGVDSGFRHVTAKEYKPRLLHLKGSKNVVIREVPMTTDSLNSGDVFVLDKGLDVYVFIGKEASPREKHRSVELVASIVSDRPNAKHQVFNEGDSDAGPFWEALGGKKPIAAAIPDTPQTFTKRLFHLSDETGKMQMNELKNWNLSSLKSEDAFILDAGFEVFVWVGKKASKDEKSQALGYATDYLFKNNRPKTLPISRILEGSENQYFENAFK